MKESPNFHYEITFPDFAPSDAIRADIEHYLLKLERVFDKIVHCQVAVRAPHMHSKKHIYHINIRLEIPGKDIVIHQESQKNMAHMDAHVAIRDAFNALHRQLKKRVGIMQEKVPAQKGYKRGVIKSFDPNQGYGFVKDVSGRDVYFHENSVIHGEIQTGSKVKYADEQGEKGRQVTSMSVM